MAVQGCLCEPAATVYSGRGSVRLICVAPEGVSFRARLPPGAAGRVERLEIGKGVLSIYRKLLSNFRYNEIS